MGRGCHTASPRKDRRHPSLEQPWRVQAPKYGVLEVLKTLPTMVLGTLGQHTWSGKLMRVEDHCHNLRSKPWALSKDP